MNRLAAIAGVLTAVLLAGCHVRYHDHDDDDWSDDWPNPGATPPSRQFPGTPGHAGDRCGQSSECTMGCFCEPNGRVCRASSTCARDRDCAAGFFCDDRHTCAPGTRPNPGGGGTGGFSGTAGAGGEGDSGGAGGQGGDGSGGEPGLPPTSIDAGTTPPPDHGHPGGSDAGTTPPATTPGLPPPLCRSDMQCAGGRCVAGGCQRRCDVDAHCGTGQACLDGHCQASPQPGGACVFSSDCGRGACVNGYCLGTCTGDGDCTNPADFCDRGWCRPDVRPVAQCTASSQCVAGRTCVDAVCRTPCRDDGQCGPNCSGTVCWKGYCVMPDEIVPTTCPAVPTCGTPMGCGGCR